MIWTEEATARFDDTDISELYASDVLKAGLTAENIAARDFRDYVKPEDVEKAIELCWK